MKFYLPFLALLFFAQSCNMTSIEDAKETESSADGDFSADWESLAKVNESPDWFADSKLGIYFHWGPYAVPENSSEWYPRNMYLPGQEAYDYHKKTFGDQAEFGYHDFIPKFTAEKFNADEIADLMQMAGAKWGGPVAQHHDGFAMWDSEVNPWNAAEMGPKRDITGEMAKALRARGMKLITSFHHARNLQRNAANEKYWDGWDSHYPFNPDWDTSTEDEKLKWLYGNVPAEEWYPYWLGQLEEVIDQYDPDIIWFDVWLNLIPEEYRKEFCAYYLNHAKANGQEVVIAHKKDDLPLDVSILDIEQGGKKDASERVWLTDITLSNQSWSYVKGQTYKDPKIVIRNFIDVVSKNGVVLLNISPRADGSIPDEQVAVLKELGSWLSEYGEAIYNTRARMEYGFGSAKAKDGNHGGQSATVKYGPGDVRFTEAKDHSAIYVIFLGTPETGTKVNLKSLSSIQYPPASKVKKATLLGSGAEVEFAINEHENYIVIPDAPMNEMATVVKLELSGSK